MISAFTVGGYHLRSGDSYTMPGHAAIELKSGEKIETSDFVRQLRKVLTNTSGRRPPSLMLETMLSWTRTSDLGTCQ